MRGLLSCLLGCSLLACHAPAQNTDVTKRSGDPLVEHESQELFKEGQALARAGDLVRAEQYLNAAAERGYPTSETVPLLIDVCIRGSRYDAALAHARPQLALEPGNWRLRFLVATLHLAVGHKHNAKSELTRVLLDAPDAENAHYEMGRLLWTESDKQTAIAHWGRYLELAPEGKHAADVRALMRLESQLGNKDAASGENAEPVQVPSKIAPPKKIEQL